MAAAEITRRVHDAETAVLGDIRQANKVVELVTCLISSSSTAPNAVHTCIHAVRRVFVHLLSTERMVVYGLDAHTLSSAKAKLAQWLYKRYTSTIAHLGELVKTARIDVQTHSVRSLLELSKHDYMLQARPSRQVMLGVRTFSLLVRSLLSASGMEALCPLLEEELLSFHDCAYCVLHTIAALLRDLRVQGRDENEYVRVENALELLFRVADEQNYDHRAFLVPLSSRAHSNGARSKQHSDDEHDDNEEEKDDDDDDDDDNDEQDFKSETAETATKSKRKRAGCASLDERLISEAHFAKALTRAWISVLRLRLSKAQYKRVLRWLPDHLLPLCTQPLQLADFFTESFKQGGIVAVLALDGLFKLLTEHNLDNKEFFPSLYALCNTRTLYAKYTSRFFQLLSASLRSSNLPAYTVAAFVKRLNQSALFASPSSIIFVVALTVQLLRRHPELIVLIHRDTPVSDEFDPSATVELEQVAALTSSLWELEALQKHYLHTIATMAGSVMTAPETTRGGAGSTPFHLQDFMQESYASMMRQELKRAKRLKTAPLAFVKPSGLLTPGDLIDQNFALSEAQTAQERQSSS